MLDWRLAGLAATDGADGHLALLRLANLPDEVAHVVAARAAADDVEVARAQLLDVEVLQARATLGASESASGAAARRRGGGDGVVSYSLINRVYAVSTITLPASFVAQVDDGTAGLGLRRSVEWQPREVARDELSQQAKNSLGSVLALFQVPDFARQELASVVQGIAQLPRISETTVIQTEEPEEDPWSAVDTQSLERIKDLVAALKWDEMQDLIAGILRAMGYKTQVSPPGADRGKDIIASPDGFGFEHPRIIVEVKHRKGQMDSQAIRSFLGGRHAQDRGLYVSTGGFTRDAFYEADRASIPVTLWTLDHIVRTLIDYYDQTDSETKRLVPLKRLYWPA